MPSTGVQKRSLLRTVVLGGVLGALLGTVAQASPATELFRAASGDVVREYFGWSSANLATLTDKYGAVLEGRCAAQVDSCPYSTARDVLGELLREVGDPHTSVRDPDAARRLDEIARNAPVPRTGARVVRVEGGLLVASVMPGSPAHVAGLRALDLITAVNGEAAGKTGRVNTPIGPNEFINLEREAQTLHLTVRRPGSPEVTVDVGTRDLAARDEPTLGWAGTDGRVAVVTVPSFLPDDTADTFLKLVRDAQAQGARGLVVDLRFNTGGGLPQCVAAASIFGPVSYRMQFRQGAQVMVGVRGETPRRPPRPGDRPPADARVWDGPAAVLVGPDTASCAEVFAYYAQQAGVPAVGDVTRGVGNSGVNFEPLPDGGVLTVTVLRAFAAAGQPLPERITPDVRAPLDIGALSTTGQDSTLLVALDALRAPGADAPALLEPPPVP